MIDGKKYEHMINSIIINDINLVKDLENFIQKNIDILGEIEEIKHVFREYNYIYQFSLPELNWDCWIQVNHGTFIYQRGVNPNYLLKFEIPNAVLKEILKGKMLTFEGYMKGLIKAEGEIKDLFRFKNILKKICLYISYYFKEMN